MKDTVQETTAWRKLEANSKRKLILCASRTEKESWMYNLEKALFLDSSYVFQTRAAWDNIAVKDLKLGHEFVIMPVTVNQWSWPNKLKGICYDEIILTRLASREIENPELIEGAFAGCRSEGSVKDNGLYYLINNDPRVASVLFDQVEAYSAKTPAAKGFDFPPSLFRRCMTEYFEDWRNPTPEEFLFALTMEGVSGNTSREKEAIEAANLYVKNKGNPADSSIAQ